MSTDSKSSSKTLLLVDDNEGDRKLMSIVLKEEGYNLLEAQNGSDALEIFKSHSEKIDLVLTDILMPEMDGVKLVELIRKEAPKIKVVFISGYKRPCSKIIDGENVDFVEKSSDLSHLVQKVREVLADKGIIINWFNKVMLRG